MIIDSIVIENEMFEAKYMYESMWCVCWFPVQDFTEWLNCKYPNFKGTFRMSKNPDIVCKYIDEMIGSDGHKYLLDVHRNKYLQDTLNDMNIIYSE